MSMRVGAAVLEGPCFAVFYWHCIWC